MPYKEPEKQRAYLRNWRRNRKLQETHSPSHHAPQQTVRNQPPLHGQFLQSAASKTPPAMDQRALKLSPDGAPQTGRVATQAYQVSRGQLRTSPKSIAIRRSPIVFAATRPRHVAMPTASVLVALLARIFS